MKNTVRQQKVFVTLDKVLQIQKHFFELVQSVNQGSPSGIGHNMARDQARGMAKVIRELELPIDIPQGY